MGGCNVELCIVLGLDGYVTSGDGFRSWNRLILEQLSFLYFYVLGMASNNLVLHVLSIVDTKTIVNLTLVRTRDEGAVSNLTSTGAEHSGLRFITSG